MKCLVINDLNRQRKSIKIKLRLYLYIYKIKDIILKLHTFFIKIQLTFFLFLGFTQILYAKIQPENFKIQPVLNKTFLDLTKRYANRHYHHNSYALVNPKMIVIHYTHAASLNQSIRRYLEPKINASNKLSQWGEVNVTTHFLIGTKGDVYSFVPTTIIARHTMGFNHTSIAIQNVATVGDYLTKKQIDTNAALIQYLLFKHPSIEYLIGHLEYQNKTLEHYKLFKSYDTTLSPLIKIDPGWIFIEKLRKTLANDYQIVLKK